jgi:hypothetical protein
MGIDLLRMSRAITVCEFCDGKQVSGCRLLAHQRRTADITASIASRVCRFTVRISPSRFMEFVLGAACSLGRSWDRLGSKHCIQMANRELGITRMPDDARLDNSKSKDGHSAAAIAA